MHCSFPAPADDIFKTFCLIWPLTKLLFFFQIFVEELASRTAGRYHCFRANEDVCYKALSCCNFMLYLVGSVF